MHSKKNRLYSTDNVDKIIDDMTLFDDDFMSKVFDENIPATELLLKIILQREDIRVVSVVGQKELETPVVGGRTIRLDILAKNKNGELFNVEVQRSNAGANEKRARFHSSMIDGRMLKEGQAFQELLESYVIIITQTGYFGYGMPIYTVNRYLEEIDKVFQDGSHILYVNGSYRGNDAVGRLMQDFSCKEAKDMHYPELANSVKHFKEEGGREDMCEAVEKFAKEYAIEYAKEYAEEYAVRVTIEDAISYGMSKEVILNKVNQKYGVSMEEAEELYEQILKEEQKVLQSTVAKNNR